jgi:succinoglycan biosynthesis protein ExoL
MGVSLRIAYFVHDLSDPAVGKRVRMLKAAGADVVVIGFRRRDQAISDVHGARAIDLGRTHDSRFAQRAFKVLQQGLGLSRWRHDVEGADVLLARNLEMLVLATAAKRSCARKASLVYECLDLHRLLLSNGIAGKLLRLLERRLMRKIRLLIISSPAFLSEYFAPKQGINRENRIPVLLVENKVLDLDANPSATRTPLSAAPPSGPPWRIGWFGMIRCRKSLDILCALAAQRPGLVEIVIRGRPARVEFENFDEQVSRTPGVSFGGSYEPCELAHLYQSVHFNWAVDFFEEGANSTLLLPNRIYEGGRHAAVPIALAHTETGRWLKHRGLGVLLNSAADELRQFLELLTTTDYARLKQAAGAALVSGFIADRQDCDSLLDALANTRSERIEAGGPAAALAKGSVAGWVNRT